ncbi:ECF RNA polymerase sigma factor SigW [Bacillus sp. THAF10]|uniref:RNA polymerase sigma factor n=1 Tax=Bacillus sp. THAF10 TaxID=2587848 RepID=UPI001268934E|nr:RNA polymerase sigma factor [Bacillus sp. THAF10]QFT90741.1 ECF RNA polymerase sigma factor SigW [Bacillus sp. THAF10]
MEQDDLYYVDSVLKGNKQAYSFIINRYKNRLYAVILRMVKNPDDAQDLVQECFIKAYEQLAKYDQKGSFPGWLYRVSVNHCMDYFRKKKLEMVEFSEDHGGVNVTPEIAYLQKEKYMHLEKLLAHLSKEDRLIILLKYTKDLTYEEIGQLLEIPVQSVANKIHRAKKKMREKMEQKEGGYFHEMYHIR